MEFGAGYGDRGTAAIAKALDGLSGSLRGLGGAGGRGIDSIDSIDSVRPSDHRLFAPPAGNAASGSGPQPGLHLGWGRLCVERGLPLYLR